MSQIRCIYRGAAPEFPATDQHPDAERFFVSDSVIRNAAEWQKLVDVAMDAAKLAVFGTADAEAIEAAIEAAGEARGALKVSLTQEAFARLPVTDIVVDALDGAPTRIEIDAVLNPRLPPPLTPAQKIAAALDMSVSDLRKLLSDA